MKSTLMMWLERYPQRLTYPLAGLCLALGAPIGFFLVRSLSAGLIPSPMWVEVEARERLDAYVYLTFATAIVFVWLGRKLGLDKDRLRADSLTDPLTSLPNRRDLDQRVRDLLQKRPAAEPLSALLIDVDDLKRINDAHGHESGDRALCAVATTLRRVCRREDVFARYGGDEFVVVLPSRRSEEALVIARRICATMERISSLNGLGRLSVSIGVTDVDRAGGRTMMALIRAADSSLQIAKLNGKNCAHLADRAKP